MAVIGVVVVLVTLAAGAYALFEPESGTLSGGATVVSNSGASGGQAIKFAAGATPTPTPSGSCALPKYPTPSCTGVPAGTTYTNTVNGDYEATTPGQVIDKWHIKGQLRVLADNVVITNSKIEGGVFNQFGGGSIAIYAHPYTITDSTLGPDTGCSRIAGLQSGNYTATRVYIHNTDHGIDMSEPGHIKLRDSFVTLCWVDATVSPPDGSHTDGIQTYCPEAACPDGELTHNTMDDGPMGHGTFTINMNTPNLVGPVNVSDNLLFGASNYVILMEWFAGPNYTVHNNRIVNGTWGSTNPYGAVSAEGTCAHQDWQGNTIVTVDSSFNVTGTLQPIGCID
jgi:hypothetical protein